MANQTVYPYGTGGSLPSSIGIINDCVTGGADKAFSAEQGKYLNQRSVRTFFTNSEQADWQTGNISSGKIVTKYANKYLLLDSFPEGVTSLIVTRTAPDSTYTLGVYGSSNGVDFTALSGFGTGSGRKTYLLGNYNSILFLLFDKPTTARAQQEGLVVQYENATAIGETDVATRLFSSRGTVVGTDLLRLMAQDLWIKKLAPPTADFYWEQGGINGSTGAEETNARAIRSNWIKVRKTDQVYLQDNPISRYNFLVVFYDSSKAKAGSNAYHFGDLPEIQRYINTDYGYFRMVYYGANNITPTNADAAKARILVTAAVTPGGGGGETKTYENPVLRVDNPDPTVWYGEDGYYYLFATGNLSSKKMYRSANLYEWEATGDAPFNQEEALKVAQAFGASSVNQDFWAPHVFKVNPTTWNLYLTKPNTGGVAILTSHHPTMGYTFVKFLTGGGGQDIDAEVARDTDGKLWMFVGGSKSIYRRQMTDDGLDWAAGSSAQRCAGNTSGSYRENTFEGPFLYRRKGYWYLFCSSGQYQTGNYKLRVVRSATLSGTFVDKAGNNSTDGYAETVLVSSESLTGPGHNAPIFVDSNNDTWILYHSHWVAASSSSQRPVCLDKVEWDEDGWPFINDGIPSSSHDIPGVF